MRHVLICDAAVASNHPGVRIGSLQFESNLFLSPLAGYTNLPFRLVVREIGGLDWATTDLINARSLLERNHKALQLAQTCAAEKILSVQLFGAVPEEMRDAAALVESMGIASVDINMGCPVRKVVGIGGGSAMMTELKKTQALVRGMIDAVKIPITAKMRLGWDEDNLTAPDLARALEDVGVAAIFVHGRTRAQGFSGTINLAGIRAVVQAVKTIPVIGNGDVTTPAAAKRMLEETGCAGVSIGRGAFYNPWIFRDTCAYLRTGVLPAEAGFAERIAVMRRHLDLACEVFGEELGCRLFRKPAAWYAKRFGPAKEFKKAVVSLRTRAEFDDIVARFEKWRAPFCDERGELLPRFRPDPLVASFMRDDADDPASVRREFIPVPKGPVDTW
ncbi:MAG: tRNA dihydrouridine synthase DusB [Candidatus Didemnitutus sp.]|nr:tRNA dihydrouridine synthase DusB [Candidatus Didemnitutus sp.]